MEFSEVVELLANLCILLFVVLLLAELIYSRFFEKKEREEVEEPHCEDCPYCMQREEKTDDKKDE